MTSNPFDAEALVDAMASLLGLTLTPESRAETIVHLADRGGAGGEASFRLARRSGGARAGVHAVTAELLDGSAQAIAAAVRTGAASAREIVQETVRRIEVRNSALGAFTDVTTARALAKADAIDCGAGAWSEPGAARGRAVRRQEPVRHRRTADARRLQDQPRSRAGRGGRDAGRAPGGGSGPSWSARSTWASTPTTSPVRTPTTALPATRTISAT